MIKGRANVCPASAVLIVIVVVMWVVSWPLGVCCFSLELGERLGGTRSCATEEDQPRY